MLAALAAVALGFVLRRLGLERVAWPTVLAAALGSDLWAVGSQGLWQHGPAALCLTLALLLLLDPSPSRRVLALAGVATAGMVVCRPIDLVFAGVIAVWVRWRFPRRERLAFFLPALGIAVGLCVYNVWFFDTLTGGQAQLETTHPAYHGIKGTWTGDLLGGAAGTLFSPSHGLFVYSPWVALALGGLPWTFRRLERGSVARWAFWGLLPIFVVLSKYSCWWGGHCFGPRFWIDALPLFAIALGLALDGARERCRPLLVAAGLSVAVAVGIQAIGAFCYPSSWHGTPTNADLDHARLWDWRDSELTRCVREGLRPRQW